MDTQGRLKKITVDRNGYVDQPCWTEVERKFNAQLTTTLGRTWSSVDSGHLVCKITINRARHLGQLWQVRSHGHLSFNHDIQNTTCVFRRFKFKEY